MNQKNKIAESPRQTPPDPAPFAYSDYIRARTALSQLPCGPCQYFTVTGGSGMGKTSLARELSAQLEGSRNSLFYLSSSRISAMGLVRCVAHKLHIWPKRNYLETVQLVCSTLNTAAGKVLLWIDEADQADVQTLQEVRMIAEAELRDTPLLSVVLCGLPSLLAQLDCAALFPLKRRIAQHCQLAGLKRDELDPFLLHRFGSLDEKRIPLAIRDQLFERTLAAPALIDKIISQALAHHGPGPLDPEVCYAILDANGL